MTVTVSIVNAHSNDRRTQQHTQKALKANCNDRQQTDGLRVIRARWNLQSSTCVSRGCARPSWRTTAAAAGEMRWRHWEAVWTRTTRRRSRRRRRTGRASRRAHQDISQSRHHRCVWHTQYNRHKVPLCDALECTAGLEAERSRLSLPYTT